MKKMLMFSSILFAFSASISFYAGDLKISLYGNDRYILGEEINISQCWENIGTESLYIMDKSGFPITEITVRVGGIINKDCIPSKPLAETSQRAIVPPPVPFKAGEKKLMPTIKAFEYGITNEGEYEIWVEYDALKLPEKIYNAGYQKIKVESNHIKFVVEMPRGDDLKVYRLYHNACNQITISSSELLQRFPTSTYAGYQLCKGGPSLRRAAEIDDAKRDMDWAIPKGASSEDQEKRRDTMRQGYEEYVTRVRNFLKAHPDFVKADVLRKNLAVFLLYLDKRSEAVEQLEILAKMEGKNAEEAREVLACMEGKKKIEAAPVEKSVPEPKEEK